MHDRGMFANAVGSSRFLALEALVHSLVLFLERPACECVSDCVGQTKSTVTWTAARQNFYFRFAVIFHPFLGRRRRRGASDTTPLII